MKSPQIAVPGARWAPVLLGLTMGLLLSTGPVAAAPFFEEVSRADVGADGYPETSRYFNLELADMQALLASAPLESFDAPVAGLTLSLPLPTNASERFAIWESSILHPDLAAKFPEIRLFLVPNVRSGIPNRDVKAEWKACSPESVPPFSAVLYFFGRNLHRQLKVPVGLIASAWGGSRIEPEVMHEAPRPWANQEDPSWTAPLPLSIQARSASE